MDAVLCVGYARQEVTPDESIPLTGYSNEPKRFHQELGHPICVTCVAVSDDADNTVLMLGLDICTIPDGYFEALEDIAKEVGVPADRIYMSATHTHASPGVRHPRFPEIVRYNEKFMAALIQVCKDAQADRKPATMYTGSIETDKMNFVKHYKCKEKGGSRVWYIGDNFGEPDKSVLMEHATIADPTLHVLKFAREGGKDVVIANFRAHPHFDGGSKKYVLSSDFIGAFRTALEAMTDCHAVYFQGASGNINSSTRMPSERRFTTSHSYGLALAGYCMECMSKCMTEVPGGRIRTKQIKFFGDINHTMDHLAQIGRQLREEWNQDFDTAKCKANGAPYGIRSPYHAAAIWTNSRRNKEEDGWMILNAVAFGDDFAFVTFPGEMYDSVSVRMEENSPFNTTMMLGYCYHHVGYLPSRVAYKYTSYETDITRFAPGTGEKVADAQVEMLEELKNS